MKQKFTITIEQKGKTFFASCKEMPDATAEDHDKITVLKKIEEVIKKKVGGDSEGGTAPLTSPKPPRPRGPNTLIELEKIPE